MVPPAVVDLGDSALLVGSFATLLTAIGSFVVILVRLKRTSTTLSRVDDQLNNVEPNYSGEHGAPTLAQRVQSMARTVDRGFARNADDLSALRDLVRDHARLLHSLNERLDERTGWGDEMVAWAHGVIDRLDAQDAKLAAELAEREHTIDTALGERERTVDSALADREAVIDAAHDLAHPNSDVP